ncbi:MAG: hypothetical protein H6568_02525 [Lewinellaceae bacterium]|nr:hypothetical protein [Saprospiraceae bacterium]MCB9311616.1 hypothetical protein [Lewinellaceae bacterium]
MKHLLSLLLAAVLYLVGSMSLVAQPLGCHYYQGELHVEEPGPVAQSRMRAAIERSDSIDILHYEIWLDVTKFGGTLKARTTVTLTPKLPDQQQLIFDLTKLTVDSIQLDGVNLPFTYPDPFLVVDLPQPLELGDTLALTFFYQGTPYKDPSWGGFYFEGGYAYNLGIGITSNPPNFGRVWYPCFDNFVERATYDIHVLSSMGRRGYAIGDFIEETVAGQDSVWRHYRMEQLLPTYLTNVAVSNYVAHRDTHESVFGKVPIELLAKPEDINDMITGFSRMGDAIDAIEAWYGPYPWSRVGYVMTTVGAMEHPTNVAFPDNALNNGAGDVRLMTHELGHHWWGNITTLREPTDMWIKEGNAEYCAHLIDEWSEGRDVFVNTVKSNHLNVLVQAHQADGDFLPLSGLPFQNIYGRHTYWKGASVMHNLRGYLGDSLFRMAQQSILATYPYSAIDAETYRDHVTQVTGIDASPFFDAWIFSPGFASFKIVSSSVQPVGNEFEVDLVVQQGLRAAPAYHESVPLSVTFYNQDWEKFKTTIQASGAVSSHSLTVPFEPVHMALNEGYELNLARMDFQQTIKSPGTYLFPFVRFKATVEQVADSALIRVDHHWTAPDQVLGQPELKISETNFWVVSGIFPSGFAAQGRLAYDANMGNAFLDAGIASPKEDSLVLLYRSSPTEEWQEHPDYKVIALLPTDGKGEVVVQQLSPGEYALARGRFIYTSTEDLPDLSRVRIFPNPSHGEVWINWPDVKITPVQYRWLNSMGQVVGQGPLAEDLLTGSVFQIPDHQLSSGQYFLQLFASDGRSVSRTIILH